MIYNMFTFDHALHNMPSDEHLTTRKAIKLKFIHLETEQLRNYMEDLESSLNLYKQILQGIVSAKPKEFNLSSESNELSLLPGKLFESLLSEKTMLEERLRKNIIAKNDAFQKANYHEELLKLSQDKEENIIKEYEEKISSLLAESEYKERIIKDLQGRNSLLEKDLELYNKSKEKQLSIQDQKGLYKKKAEIMIGILAKLENKYDIAYKNIQHLLVQCNHLIDEYKRGNSMLREPQPDINIDEILNFPNRDVSCDEFWMTKDKNIRKIFLDLNININDNQAFSLKVNSPKNGNFHLNQLELKQEKLKKKCEEYRIKLQMISQEIESAKRLKKLLKQDQEHLNTAVSRFKTLEKELKNLIKQKMLANEENDESNTFPRIMRSNSNPLEYAQFHFGEFKREKRKKELTLEEFNEVQDKDVSLILQSVISEDIINDSLMEIFDEEVMIN